MPFSPNYLFNEKVPARILYTHTPITTGTDLRVKYDRHVLLKWLDNPYMLDTLLTAFEEDDYKRRAEAQGFKFTDAEIYLDSQKGFIILRVDFTCVCGTPERLQVSIPEYNLRYSNLQRLPTLWENLYRNGSFSKEHLEADGFSKEVIEDILHKGELFDKGHSECLITTKRPLLPY